MSSPPITPHSPLIAPRVAVVGGGISGLAAAIRLTDLAPDARITLYEASDRLGGVLRTTREAGYLLEHSADNFITNLPAALKLCRRLGLAEELLPTNAALRGAEVVSRGQLHRVPEGFMLMAPHDLKAVWRSPLLSWRGKLRLLGEFLAPRRNVLLDDECLRSFVTRRLGREAFERLVQPLVGGIYTADAEKLSMAAALGKFWKMERLHGSLIRAVLSKRKKQSTASESAGSGARYSLFTAPREGMQQLVDAIAAQLPPNTVRLGVAVERILRQENHWCLEFSSGEIVEHDAVIVAAPAPRAARMLHTLDEPLAAELARIPYAGAAIALLGYRLDQLGRPPRSFGFVVPEVERREILAASFSSLKFPGRAPDGRVLIRVFLGGAKHPELIGLEDSAIKQIVTRELGELLTIRGEPELFRVERWRGAMPQYHVGHLSRLERIQTALKSHPTLALAGNAYRGVGIPQCIASGMKAVQRVLRQFPAARRPRG